jgi:hypothetical protein
MSKMLETLYLHNLAVHPVAPQKRTAGEVGYYPLAEGTKFFSGELSRHHQFNRAVGRCRRY